MIYNLNQHRINQEHRLIGFLIADFSLFFDADTQSRIRKYFQGDCERYRAFLRTLKAIIKILKGLDEIGLNPCFNNCAEGGTRTRTAITDRGILSPSLTPGVQ